MAAGALRLVMILAVVRLVPLVIAESSTAGMGLRVRMMRRARTGSQSRMVIRVTVLAQSRRRGYY
jgi:hypothetical protein